GGPTWSHGRCQNRNQIQCHRRSVAHEHGAIWPSAYFLDDPGQEGCSSEPILQFYSGRWHIRR
ncbi:hypothetical protein AB1N83_014262, partial [Pleurotus pulmonarius]